MPLFLVRNDITKMECDAIVNAANSSLLGGGGVDGAIHKAAGPELLEKTKTLGGCEPGKAKLTKGYKLPASYIIHTAGPKWHGGNEGEADILKSCYVSCLEIAKKNKFKTVAFPLISTGIYGYPKDEAMRIACDTIEEFLISGPDMMVYLVFFDTGSYCIGKELYKEIACFIDDNYYEAYREPGHDRDARLQNSASITGNMFPSEVGRSFTEDDITECQYSIESMVRHMDESFTDYLLKKIDEKGITDTECYKRANVDRRLFSKIRSNRLYHPKKYTAIAFADALRLNLAETNELLMKAGYILTHSSKADTIIEYCINNNIYDIYKINETLFSFDQPLLG